MILQYDNNLFEYREDNSNLFCFSLAELIKTAKVLYNKDLLEILN